MMNAKQKAVIESEQLTAKVNAILDATVEHLHKRFPEVHEIKREITIKSCENGVLKVGEMVLDGVHENNYKLVEFRIGFVDGKQSIRLVFGSKDKKAIYGAGFGFHEADNDTKAAIMAIAKAK